MMSLLRIIVGVLVGVGFFVGIGFLAQRFPTTARYVGLSVILFFPAVLSAWTIRYCVRVGEVKGRWTPRYRRGTSPVHFWFYISLYAVLGALFFVGGICAIFVPKLLGLK